MPTVSRRLKVGYLHMRRHPHDPRMSTLVTGLPKLLCLRGLLLPLKIALPSRLFPVMNLLLQPWRLMTMLAQLQVIHPPAS